MESPAAGETHPRLRPARNTLHHIDALHGIIAMLARAHLDGLGHAVDEDLRDLVRDDNRQEGARIRLMTGAGAWRLRWVSRYSSPNRAFSGVIGRVRT